MTLASIQLPGNSNVDTQPVKRYSISGHFVALTPLFFGTNPVPARIDPTTGHVDESGSSGWPCARTDHLNMVVHPESLKPVGAPSDVKERRINNSLLVSVPVVQGDIFAAAVLRAAADVVVARLKRRDVDVTASNLTALAVEPLASAAPLSIDSVIRMRQRQDDVFLGTFFCGDNDKIEQTRFDNLLSLVDETADFTRIQGASSVTTDLKLADLTRVICSTQAQDREMCERVVEAGGEYLDEVIHNYLQQSQSNFANLALSGETSGAGYVFRQVVNPKVRFTCAVERLGTEAQLGMLLLSLEKLADYCLGDRADLGFGRFAFENFTVNLDQQEIGVFDPVTTQLSGHVAIQSAIKAAFLQIDRDSVKWPLGRVEQL